ncbi:hypothetical protein KJ618_00030 [Patescibacteria group bacterium]|nr:hypothetical protein [Patescibacteria group bacterium]
MKRKSFNLMFPKMSRIYPLLILLLIGFCVLGGSLRNGFVWDDTALVMTYMPILSNKSIPNLLVKGFPFQHAAIGFFNFYYKPFAHIVYKIVYIFFGVSPLAYHAFQLIIHSACAFLVYSLFLLFFPKILAFFLSVVFLIHPINLEASIYTAALQDTLYLFFGLLALRTTFMRSNKVFLILSSLCLLLSLLSKETGVVFILLFPLFILLEKRERINKALLTSLIAFVTYLILRFIAAHNVYDIQLLPSAIMSKSLLIRLLSVPKILLYYFQTFFFPIHLSIDQHWLITTPAMSNFYIPFIIDAIVILLLILVSRLCRKDKKEQRAYILFMSWLTISLILHLHIIPLDMTVADRWFYASSIGILGVMGLLFIHIQNKISSKILYTFFCIIFITLSMRSIVRIQNWKDNLTLYLHDSDVHTNYDLENLIAGEYLLKNQNEEAIAHYVRSISFFPTTRALNNLGSLYNKIGQNEKSIEYYYQALALDKKQFEPYYNLATNLKKNNPQESKKILQEGIQLFPTNLRLWSLLAEVEIQLGKPSNAVVIYDEIKRIQKENRTN